MSGVPSLEETIRSFLESKQDGAQASDSEIGSLLSEFSELLFENPEQEQAKKILIHQIGSFELDEFLNFYLEDMHPDDPAILSKARSFLKKFRKFLDKRGFLTKDQQIDWKEFFQENGI